MHRVTWGRAVPHRHSEKPKAFGDLNGASLVVAGITSVQTQAAAFPSFTPSAQMFKLTLEMSRSLSRACPYAENPVSQPCRIIK